MSFSNNYENLKYRTSVEFIIKCLGSQQNIPNEYLIVFKLDKEFFLSKTLCQINRQKKFKIRAKNTN
jgi:hypothetical protein